MDSFVPEGKSDSNDDEDGRSSAGGSNGSQDGSENSSEDSGGSDGSQQDSNDEDGGDSNDEDGGSGGSRSSSEEDDEETEPCRLCTTFPRGTMFVLETTERGFETPSVFPIRCATCPIKKGAAPFKLEITTGDFHFFLTYITGPIN